jgi:predicted nucleic acid-binding protein
MSRIFVDANIPIYAVGRPHPLKNPSLEILRLIAQHPNAFVTDAEVLQEILHRYLSLRFWPRPGLSALESFEVLMRGRIEAVSASDVMVAAHLAEAHQRLSARDLLHVSIARRLGAGAIVSADRDFDDVPTIERLDPADAAWHARALAE